MKLLLAVGALFLLLSTAGRTAPATFAIHAVPFEIKESGHYSLDQDVMARPGTEGITITASDVVLDLGGFTLSTTSVSGNTAAGVTIGPAKNVVVRNGTVRGFANGIIVLGSTTTELNSAHLLQNLRVLECRNEGIYVEGGCGGSAVRHCEVIGIGPAASGNAVGVDLRCSEGVVSETRVQASDIGISILGPRCLVSGNTVSAGGFGIDFESGGTGVRMANIVLGATTPYQGGTDGGSNL